MAIVVGSTTSATFNGGSTYCITSVNWSYSPNPQRTYCIGSFSADETYYKPTETMSITIYAPGPNIDVTPTEFTGNNCTDAPTIEASVSPASCGDDVSGFSGNWWVSGYNFSKEDSGMPGQESWSLTRWKGLSTDNPTVDTTIEPDYVLRAIAEGQATDNAGITFDSASATVEATTGSVSANSFGKAQTLLMGVVTNVGGGTSVVGETGQGSASIPYTPLYI